VPDVVQAYHEMRIKGSGRRPVLFPNAAGSPRPAAMTQVLHIIGGGMAGSEAAWQAASMGVPVIIH